MSRQKPMTLASAYNAGVKAGREAKPVKMLEAPPLCNHESLMMAFMSGCKDGILWRKQEGK